MSLEHIPKFVWLPIAFLLWAFFVLVVLLTIMSYRAKSMEIDLLNLAIKVQYVDQQLSIAQQNISTTMGVIDGLTQQLAQYKASVQPVTNKKHKREFFNPNEPIDMWQPQSAPINIPSKSSYDSNPPIVQQLQIQKMQLEGVSGELKHIQDNLQSSVIKKSLQ